MKLVMQNEGGVINFGMSKCLILNTAIFPHCNIHTYSSTSIHWKTGNQTDHVFVDKRQHSSKLASGLLGELIVILTTIWWLPKLGKDVQ
jgi:hypothetical protein